MHSTLRQFALLLILSAVAPTSAADLVVDADLGTLPVGGVGLSGSTAGAGNEANRYLNTTATDANWGNEFVYRFSLPQLSVLNITLRSATNDPDFFVLESTATVPSGGKIVAQDDSAAYFLDSGSPQVGSPRLLGAGTHILSAESFIGLDGAVTPQDATYEIDLTISLPEDLGTLAGPGEALTIDTLGSDFDTVLGLWDVAGTLLAQNDDAGGGDVQSVLNLAGLAPGEYYLALSGFFAEFGDGFRVESEEDSDSGNFLLNLPTGTRSGALGVGEVNYYRFRVVPEPSALLSTAVGAAALGLIHRRGRPLPPRRDAT